MTEEVKGILDQLEACYPDADCELHYSNALELLIATMLSAQTTDKQVNKVTARLFQDCSTLDDYLALTLEQIQEYIHTLGFYNTKSQNLYKMFRQLAADYAGEVPQTMEELVKLPGVGRKTANVVMSNVFDVPAIAVDTHVFRVSNRIGLVQADTVEKTERQLQEAVAKERWTKTHHVLIFHGRRCCSARNPKCELCVIQKQCKYWNGGKQ